MLFNFGEILEVRGNYDYVEVSLCASSVQMALVFDCEYLGSEGGLQFVGQRFLDLSDGEQNSSGQPKHQII